jgi:hypothetical protein
MMLEFVLHIILTSIYWYLRAGDRLEKLISSLRFSTSIAPLIRRLPLAQIPSHFNLTFLPPRTVLTISYQ